MAQPFDSASTLQSFSAAIQLKYAPKFYDQIFFTGRPTNKLIKPMEQAVVGDGMTFQSRNAGSFNGRMDTDMVSDFPTPIPLGVANYKFRFNERDQTQNDFVKYATSGRVSQYDLDNISSAGAAFNILSQTLKEIRDGFDFMTAAHRHLDRTGRICTINGTPVNNDGQVASGTGNNVCSAYTTGSTSARIVIQLTSSSAGSVAAFQPGVKLDIYNGATLVFSGAKVTDYNPQDSSVGLTRFDATSTANFDGVATGHSIYFSGEKDKNMYSLGAWFSSPSTTDSFIGATNRNTAANRYLNTTKIREGATARRISQKDFDDVCDAMAYVTDGSEVSTWVAVADPRVITAVRQDIGEDRFIPYPVDQGNNKRFANFGTGALAFQHPSLGYIVLQAEPLCPPNVIRFFRPQDWKALSYGNRNLQFMPGSNGLFNRLPSTTPGQGYGMFWQVEAFSVLGDICEYPRLSAQINAVST